MCTIAGYAGKRRAAPILLEMMKKIEFIDGGCATGIATIHEGRLYYAKIQGNVDTLLRATDAYDLPGTVGIIHTRPGADFISMTHPYLDADEKLAMVENGTPLGTGTPAFWQQQRDIMNAFLSRGIESRAQKDMDPDFHARTRMENGRSFYYIEPFAFTAGDRIKNAVDKKAAFGEAIREIHEMMPADNITVSIHADVPDTVTVGTVTRPMSVCVADGEVYLASVALAFPTEVQGCPITHLPVTSVTQITPEGFTVLTNRLDGVHVEPITDRVRIPLRAEMERQLTGKADAPLSMYEMKLPPEIWDDTQISCKYLLDPLWLKPIFYTAYQLLWDFHREGRLRHRPGTVHFSDHDQTYEKFWLTP